MVSWSVDEKIAQSTVKAGPAFLIAGGNRYECSVHNTDILSEGWCNNELQHCSPRLIRSTHQESSRLHDNLTREKVLSNVCRCEETVQSTTHTTTGQLAGLLNMMGYDNRKLGSMALNMLLYVGELTANSLLDVDNNIDTEIPQYRSFSDSGDIFSFFKVQVSDGWRKSTHFLSMLQLAVERSTRRGEEIKSVLLDKNLSTTMIEQLKDKTGARSSCVQMFLCKISPAIAVVQESSAEAISSMMDNSLENTRWNSENIWLVWSHLNIFITATYSWISSSNSFLTQNNLRGTAEIVRINIRLANFCNSTPTESKIIHSQSYSAQDSTLLQ